MRLTLLSALCLAGCGAGSQADLNWRNGGYIVHELKTYFVCGENGRDFAIKFQEDREVRYKTPEMDEIISDKTNYILYYDGRYTTMVLSEDDLRLTEDDDYFKLDFQGRYSDSTNYRARWYDNGDVLIKVPEGEKTSLKIVIPHENTNLELERDDCRISYEEEIIKPR